MNFDPKMIALLREKTANEIAEAICSVQPMDKVSFESLRAAFEWLTRSRLSRGVHPLTEEPLK